MSDDLDLERTVCFCHCVSAATLVEAIRGGCHTLIQIQEQTHASTGCGGCECEVVEILEEEIPRLAAVKTQAD
jgi:NAD(P)H-nitrite reductase large subunit